ncbi:MAG: bifunctional DNA primase/polymerase [Patescibacteria group bacterium]|nr:bifunctional DNA primase/polymerase [Patescibacteria group bacterium]
MPSNLAAALDWAKRGFYVFPCIPGKKKPLIAGGYFNATRDEDMIRRWWTITPEANIGWAPALSGHWVLDIDIKNATRGYETLEVLTHQHGPLPSTTAITTPTGGKHYWFHGTCRSTTRFLGPGIDTKGSGGYVLLPPSHTEEGVYRLANDSSALIADAPPWLMALLSKPPPEKKPAATAAPDLPANIERAEARLRKFVSEGRTAIEGQGGDDLTYKIAAEILDLGLMPETAADLMLRLWNPWCEPPWDADELAQKVENATKYRQNELGAKAEFPASEVFKSAISFSDTIQKQSRFKPIPASDFAQKFQPPEWLLQDILPKNGTIQLTGPPKSFKTFLALDIALGISVGQETFGQVPAAAPTVYIAGENAPSIALKHVPAWRLARGIEGKIPFWIVRTMPRAAVLEEIQEAAEEIRKTGIQPALIAIDTATRALRGLDENSAKDMGLFSAACEYLQRETHATILVIRHTGKDTARGGRGSNVLEGDFDTIISVARYEKSLFVKATITEQRNAAEPDEPFFFKGALTGPSLVFRPIPENDYPSENAEPEFSQTRIVEILRCLGATAEEKAIETSVLCAELEKNNPKANLSRTTRHLKLLSKSHLRAYTVQSGTLLKWCIPNIAAGH